MYCRLNGRWRIQTGGPFFALILLLFASPETRVYGTSYRTPTATESNLLAFDGKLAFIQGSGGLTVLDLRTGQVKLRKMLRDEVGYIVELQKCPEGVILISSGKASLVDSETFEYRWTIEGCRSPIVEGPYIVSNDGYHTVRCYNSITSEVRWSKEIRGGWDLVLSDGIVAVLSVPSDNGHSAIWVIDAESGKQLFHKTPPQGKQWSDVYCDGEAVYAISAPIESSDFRATPDGIVKFDLQGQEVESLDFSSPSITNLHKQFGYPVGSLFLFDGKTFARNKNCRKAYPHELDFQTERLAPNNFSIFSLPTGMLVHEESKDSADKKGHTIQLLSTDKQWKNYLPFVRPNEYLGPVEEIDGRILLCWSGGQIECLDSATGQPQWLYVFPSFRRVMSFTGHHIGNFWRSHETGRAKLFKRGLASMDETCGSIGLPDGTKSENVLWASLVDAESYRASIVIDPDPKLRFAKLPERVFRSRIVGGANLLGLLTLVIWHRRWLAKKSDEDDTTRFSAKRHFAICVVGCFAIYCLAATGLILYGRVSAWGSTLLYGIVIALFFYSSRLASQDSKEDSGLLPFIWTMLSAACAGLVIGMGVVVP